MSSFNILALAGDGIGPEVLTSGLAVASAVADMAEITLTIEHDLLHGAAWEEWGTFCRDETVHRAHKANAVLVGAVGGPKWDDIRVPGGPEMQDGLMRLRKELDAYAGLRPARHWPSLAGRTPFAKGRADGADIMVLREMCGGVMFAEPRGADTRHGARYAYDTAAYAEHELHRIAIAGFELARTRRKQLVSADKANVMESHRLWRAVISEMSIGYPDVTLTHLFADNCAYQMAMNPGQFDVIIGCNLMGDILSDLAAIVSGGLGMLPSACLCGPPGTRTKGIFEPVHGSAPDIAGHGIANPVGMILSVAMMYEHALARPDLARRIETATERAIDKGIRTPDIGGTCRTADVTAAILGEIAA